ncbi:MULTISPECIES: NAD-dependent succinate-semialdehyde dehydrogenase [unclassified Sphingopyxis]|uniref:NAD-dependent succinate-semialdehyde dehydrogenase n=1 Tax=unclassified Sphingopyxis TaxID=2614943 RepID=UPI0009E83770|nr:MULTISPECIES: NAD-dependent succinate-semialdehyde dehydrogenase [unclassified Sphingopyxis]
MTQHEYADIGLFIAGAWISPGEREAQPVINPATAEQIGLMAMATLDDLEASVRCAQAAFDDWKQRSPLDRSAILRRFANLLRQNEESIATAITLDEGKPLAEARVEVRASADHVDWHAEEGRRIYGRVIPSRSPAVQQLVLREPVGVCLAITPWNFPLSQAVRKVAAALACGCTMILKGPAEAPSACLAIARYLQEAGLPDGCLNLVWGNAAMISETLVAHPDVRKITFTGSVEVGKNLAELAGRHMKRTTMELGGHAPVLVFDDADAEGAALALAGNKLRNAGQVCISPTRFFVQAGVHQRFVDALVDAFANVKVGDGLEADVQMGPLCHARRITEMERLVEDARAGGAAVLTGGARQGNAGYFFAPTIVDTMDDRIALMRDEPFGPIAVVSRFGDISDAIDRANALPFGLASYVFTGSLERADRAAAALQAGMVSINHFGLALPETPFGGVRDSGYGTEGGSETFDGYVNTKFVSRFAGVYA